MTTILIADDHPDNRYLLEALLEGSGYEVISAANGAEALQAALTAPPSLVVSDILMPVMDGFELCRRWKRHELLREIPFVFYTATYVEPKDERFAMSLGADRFVVKPVRPDHLLAIVVELLQQAQAQAPPPPAQPLGDEMEVLRQYSEVLFRKLGRKVSQLQAEVEERRRTEEVLRLEQLKLETVTGNIGAGLAIISRDYRTVWANAVLRRMFGDILGKPCHLAYNRREAVCPDCGVKRIFEEQVERASHQQCGQDAQGATIWSEIIATPIRNDQGEVTHALELVVPITERKLLEEQFRTAQRMEAVGRLTGGIAHDFNNLLSVILSYTEFALEGRPPGDAFRNDLEEVRKAGTRAATLVRQLLAFSRKQVLEPRSLDLNRVVSELEGMLRPTLGEDIELVNVLAPDLGLTLADPGQIEQVLMNLVVNARDAMSDGGKLTIRTANVQVGDTPGAASLKPGPYVMLAVNDTGCGMDEATKARIFEPFFTTKDRGKGTGLGLATVYGIVKQSGGDVVVHSEAGRGTSFEIFLPRTSSAPPLAAPAPPAVPARPPGHETILVVEDNEAVCALAKRVLAAAGHEVLTAASGSEALQTCARRPGQIHLALADVVLPKPSGKAFAEELARLRPGIKLLFMSGYSDEEIADRVTLGPGARFIGKPFNPDELRRKVRDVLDGA